MNSATTAHARPKWTLGNATGTIFCNGDPTGFVLKIYNEIIPSANLLKDANAGAHRDELVAALKEFFDDEAVLHCMTPTWRKEVAALLKKVEGWTE